MRILGLDLGTTTGWCLSPTEAGVWSLQPKRHEGAGMRFVNFRVNLLKLLSSGVDLVAYEEVISIRAHPSTSAAHIYGGLVAILQEQCEAASIPYSGVPIATIKKHATGKGNAGKLEMAEAAVQKWALEYVIDDNEADARWIWDYAVGAWGHAG